MDAENAGCTLLFSGYLVEISMNEVLTGRIKGRICLRTKNAPKRDDGSQNRFLTRDRKWVICPNCILKIYCKVSATEKYFTRKDVNWGMWWIRHEKKNRQMEGKWIKEEREKE